MKMLLMISFLCSCGKVDSRFAPTNGYTSALLDEVISDINQAAGCQWLTKDKAGFSVTTNSGLLKEIGEKGWTDYTSNRITIADPDETNSTSNYVVLVHEIGHVVGLDHQDHGVMFKNYKHTTKSDAVDSFIKTAIDNGVVSCD